MDAKEKQVLLRKLHALEKRERALRKLEAELVQKSARKEWELGKIGVRLKQVQEAMDLAEKKKKR
jgi:hypothetical protein